ncbi:MAG: sigma-70 family RNA polymerase sigma factor [Actinomycetota bacterium]
MSGPDDLLLRRARGGDTTAFGALVQLHQTRIYAVCLRILADPEDARDAAQDAFMTAFRKLEQFRGDAAFGTWLHRIAVNACYDSLRRAKRQPMLHVRADPADERVLDDGPPTPDPADEIAGTIDVARALALIPEDFRVVLVLADIEDLPYEEIARVLEVPIGTVKSRVHRGRVALARALAEPGAVPEASEER